jgi:hypothetical protein
MCARFILILSGSAADPFFGFGFGLREKPLLHIQRPLRRTRAIPYSGLQLQDGHGHLLRCPGQGWRMVGFGSWAFGVVAAIIATAIAAPALAGWLEIRIQPQTQRRHARSDSVVYLGVCATCGHDLVWIAYGAHGTYVEDVVTRMPHEEHSLDAAAPFEDYPDAV